MSLRAGRTRRCSARCPHLALDGAAAAAAALGAREVVVAVGRGARSERAILAAALKERRDPLRWRLAVVPDGFVSGEETALLNALAGRAPKPTVKPPHPFERGLGWRADPRAERRDARATRLGRPIRLCLVPVARNGARAGNRARHPVGRRGAARRLRDRARLDDRRTGRPGAEASASRSARFSSAATSARGPGTVAWR